MTSDHPSGYPSSHSSSSKAQRFALHSVRAYYEQNSAWFRLIGRRQHNQAIHRPVWAAGVDSRQSALNYVNHCISAQLQELLARQARISLLDLGCGFGGTIHYLVRQFVPRIWAIGVTLSAQQARIAQQTAQLSQTEKFSAFVEADFHTLPFCASMDMACSVEAFAHASAPDRYFAEAARLLKPQGRLILCDDFWADGNCALSRADRRWLTLFKRGWRVPQLLSPRDASALAQQHGLQKIEEMDFSPHLHTRTFPNALLPIFEQAIQSQGRFSSLLASIIGGWALERAIRQGHITYRFLIFEKQA